MTKATRKPATKASATPAKKDSKPGVLMSAYRGVKNVYSENHREIKIMAMAAIVGGAAVAGAAELRSRLR
jgi:hypothetical protein